MKRMLRILHLIRQHIKKNEVFRRDGMRKAHCFSLHNSPRGGKARLPLHYTKRYLIRRRAATPSPRRRQGCRYATSRGRQGCRCATQRDASSVAVRRHLLQGEGCDIPQSLTGIIIYNLTKKGEHLAHTNLIYSYESIS